MSTLKADAVTAKSTNTDLTMSGAGTGEIAFASSVAGADYTVARVNLKDYGIVTNAIGSTGGGTQDIDVSLGNSVSATVDTSANINYFRGRCISIFHNRRRDYLARHGRKCRQQVSVMPNILPMMMGASGASSGTATIWSWGYNWVGGLGLGNTTDYSSPQQIGALKDWSASTDRGKVSHSYGTSGAIKDDGSLWMWGNAGSGALGDGTTTNKSSPVQIGSLTDWSFLSLGGVSGAIKTDGTLWMWGNNGDGQLGDGTATSRSSPVQIGSLTTWSKLAVASEGAHAIKTDGTLWGWGRNDTGGFVGDGTTTTRSSPVQIGALTTWAEVAGGGAYAGAIKTDGTLWMWGKNSLKGNLGVGDLTNYSSPVQVGSLTDWSKLRCGGAFTGSIKTNGTLWMWGNGFNGQIGNGTTTEVNTSPIQVGSLTDWSKLLWTSESPQNPGAIKTDGTLWVWARNDKGQLGQGNTTNTSSPVQVGSLTTWVDAGIGNKAIVGTISEQRKISYEYN